MADRFHSLDDLIRILDDRSFSQPPALIANAHITGLGVARSLPDSVPVIAVDRNGGGVAPYSDAVDYAGEVSYPLDDEARFREDIERLTDVVDHDVVGFPCMDEWVHGFARTRPQGVRLPFAANRIDSVLDKTHLYATANGLDIPYPETYQITETIPDATGPTPGLPVRPADEAIESLGLPVVVKPALKREFEEAIGTNVIEVTDRGEFTAIVEQARSAGIRIMAQTKVPVDPGGDRSFVSYVPPDTEPIGVVGKPTRYPPGYGTSCLVRRVEEPVVEERALAVLRAAEYYGISEAEFVYDTTRGEYVLLDINTRPWKWIGLPVAAGANLPAAAYADTVGDPYEAGPIRDVTWVYMRDYLARLAEGYEDHLTTDQWAALVSGKFEESHRVTTGVFRPTDPGPTVQLLSTEFSDRQYYCAC